MVSTRDFESVIRLAGELGEIIATGSHESALEHLARRAPAVVGASATWLNIMRESDPSQVSFSVVQGLSSNDLARWERYYLEEGQHIVHPIWPHVLGRAATHTVARLDVIGDREWSMHPHIRTWSHGLGHDDIALSVTPLGRDRLAAFALARELGAKPFGPRERTMLHALHDGTSWIYRRLLDPSPRAKLAPRLQRVLDLLLTGASEKQISARTGLAARTVHKYIEHVYRACEVSSRAELMARFVRRS